jgi:hypothetical protein
MYHNIRSFGKQDGLEGSQLELYFFDDDLSLEHRYRSCRKEQCAKDKEVITHLVNILLDNPYSEHLRIMGQVEDIEEYCITLNYFYSFISFFISFITRGNTWEF